jgi:CHAT domain-containing protein
VRLTRSTGVTLLCSLPSAQSICCRIRAGNFRASFAEKHQEYYRWLASLFLEIGRLGEAEFVLRLLKDFELHEYVRRDGGRDGRSERLPYSLTEAPADAAIEAPRGSIVELAKREILIEARKKGTLSPTEQVELEQLTRQMKDVASQFQTYIDNLAAAVRRLDRATERDVAQRQIMQDTFGSIGVSLATTFERKAVALHYVVLPDRFSILLTTAYGQRAWTVPVPRHELTRRIQRFRAALENPNNDPRADARYLYDLLLGPAAMEIAQSGADTILVSLDRVLRYVPFAALHSGDYFVAERYKVVGLVEASRQRLVERAQGPMRVAAFAASKGGDGLAPLPFARVEVEAIVRGTARRGVLDGTVHIDEGFTRNVLEEALEADDLPVIHVATHFVLRPGQETDSFLLLGSGQKLTAADLKRLPSPPAFASIDLLALSACQTAVPTSEEDGSEIESFGALAMIKGARSVIATLWPVADPSTAAFMRHFYELRSSGESKGAALAKTQRAFIGGHVLPESKEVATMRGRGAPGTAPRAQSASSAAGRWSHPFYWAPFLLMGNFL